MFITSFDCEIRWQTNWGKGHRLNSSFLTHELPTSHGMARSQQRQHDKLAQDCDVNAT